MKSMPIRNEVSLRCGHMINPQRFCILVISIWLASCSRVGTPRTSTGIGGFRSESSAEIQEEKDSWTYITRNSSFRFAEVLNDKGEGYDTVLLLDEHFKSENTPGIEGVRGQATIKGWTMENPRIRKLRWTIQENANEGEIRQRFYRLTRWGCCDVPNAYLYYGLLSGTKLYLSNSELIEVRGKGDGPLASRFIAFGYDTDKLDKDPLLQYGTDIRVSETFSIHSGRKYYEGPEVLVVSGQTTEKRYLNLYNSPLTFDIVLRFPSDPEMRVMRIPVENDEVRYEKATLPPGYSIRLDK